MEGFHGDSRETHEQEEMVERLLATTGSRSRYTPSYLHGLLHELSETDDAGKFKEPGS